MAAVAVETKVTLNNFELLLAQTNVTMIKIPKGKVITVTSDDSPFKGFKKLCNNNILGAPVFDLKTKRYSGFLDVRDLVSFVVYDYDNKGKDEGELPNDRLQQIIAMGSRSIGGPISCTYLSKRNVFHPISEKDSLLDAAKILATGIHRVPIIDKTTNIVTNIISQSSIIQFLYQNLDKLTTETGKTVNEMKLGSSPVFCFRGEDRTIDAFRAMSQKRLSGIAIVNEYEAFIANMSSSDLKLYLINPRLSLEMPLTQFLTQLRKQEIQKIAPALSCAPSSTLFDIIERLAETKVHKLFVVDPETFKPVAVISLTDILKYIIKK